MPKVSVIIPTYNTKESYLDEAISSILGQTFTDFELIIINDGSNESVAPLITNYNDERIRLFEYPENQGIAKIRNLGMELAKGEFIAFLDADDIAVPTRLAVQVAFLETNTHIGLVSSAYTRFPKKRKLASAKVSDGVLKSRILLRGPSVLTSAVMFRKEILIKYPVRFKEKYLVTEDYAFWLDLLPYINFARITSPLVYYRWHGENISITSEKKMKEMHYLAQKEKMKELFNIDEELTTAYQNVFFQKIVREKDLPLLEIFLEMFLHAKELPHIFSPVIARKFLAREYFFLLFKIKDIHSLQLLCNSKITSILKINKFVLLPARMKILFQSRF